VAGVPSWISDGPWWGLFTFLFIVVLLRAQATYWMGRGIRKGTEAAAARGGEDPARTSRIARRLNGPGLIRAQTFLDRWGFVGIPISFLTIGFQTMVNAAAGYGRMRWDLYTLAMIPGCVAWATMYALLGLSLVEAWRRSPLLATAVILGLITFAWTFTWWRGRRAIRSTPTEPEPTL
jgi:membrane protein DedA with SNARE-associated domain